MSGKFSLSVYLSLILLRQVSVMRCGACEESAGSLFTVKFLKVRRNRKSGNPATRALQLGQVGPLKMFEQKAPVGFPDINAGSTPTPLPLLNS